MIPTKTKSVIAATIVLILISSCNSYYKARLAPPGEGAASTIESMSQSKVFVLRGGNGQAFYLTNMSLSRDRKALAAILDSLPPGHRLHLVNGRGGKMRYVQNDPNEMAVVSEVHLYVPTVTASVGDTLSLPLNTVQKIEVLEKDVRRTKSSHVLGGIGFTLLGIVGAVAILGVVFSDAFSWKE